MTRVLMAVATLALGVALSTVAVAQQNQQQHNHASSTSSPKAVTPMKPHTGALPPLPRVSYQPPRPMAVVQQVYEFAARHPEVLQYVPCYCGCERVGHNGNHDCFVKSRAANGQVTAFDEHGMHCTICIDVARDAMTLFNGGVSPS